MSNVDYDWTSLPPELLEEIATHIKIYSDYICFRAVSPSWRSLIPATPTHLPCQLPWLMLGKCQSSNHRRRFLNLANNKYHSLRLPETFHHRRCCGSSHGWLVILEKSPSIIIVNPLTRAKLELPPLSSFPCVYRFDISKVGREYLLTPPPEDDGNLHERWSLKEMRDSFIKKIVLSNSPFSGEHLTALAIIDRTGDLACCKLGQTQWTLIKGARSFSEDVIYFNGLFFAVHKNGSIAICDVSGDSPQVTEFIHTTGSSEGGEAQYLVAACGELLLITRYIELADSLDGLDTYVTHEFRVFRLDLGGKKWERVMNLGEQALFLGGNSSLALLASDFPGCKGNRIYFTEVYCDEIDYEGLSGDHDLGIFSLEDGSIERLPCYPRDSRSYAIWITPNPC